MWEDESALCRGMGYLVKYFCHHKLPEAEGEPKKLMESNLYWRLYKEITWTRPIRNRYEMQIWSSDMHQRPRGKRTMPPVTSLSLPSASPKALSPLPILARSLSSRTQPKRGFFGTLFNAIKSLGSVESILSHINGLWRYIHPIHEKNTKLAQYELDAEYGEYHDTEWANKQRRASVRVMNRLAVDEPYLFARGYILNKKKGSHERKMMAGILKFYNPRYYQEHEILLGEAIEIKVATDETDGESELDTEEEEI